MARIMIIDDDVELAEGTALRIRQRGHEVTTVFSTDEAVRRISEHQPDLVLLDVMFPDNPVCGFDLARHLRRIKAFETLPIILLTNVNQHFPMDFSSKDIDPDWMPVQGLMEKPVDLDALMKKVDELLKKA